MTERRSAPLALIASCVLVLSGCGGHGGIASSADPYMPQWLEPGGAIDRAACSDQGVAPAALNSSAPTVRGGLPLSPGDTVRITVPEGADFTGLHVVDADGALKLPFLDPIQAAGATAPSLEREIAAQLVAKKLFRDTFVRVSVQPVQWAPVQILVSGAVFQPGVLIINERKTDERTHPEGAVAGDYAPGRSLSAALRGAGGVRPDADLRAVRLERAGRSYRLDLRGMLSGAKTADPPLIAGDAISVPSLGCFQDAMMRPSLITPPGVRVYLSNLTTPAITNSQAGISKDASSLPYGTRLLQALVSANCVGGNLATNSDRYAVLITANPVTGQSQVLERSVEQLVTDPGRDAYNPYLMPNDGIACYESGFATARDLAKAISDAIAPVSTGAILGLAIKGAGSK